jgi:hypothetical protein
MSKNVKVNLWPPFKRSGSTITQRTAGDILDLTSYVNFSTGVAVSAATYWVGRDADGTNQFHYNVPTGAGYEWSVNDVAVATLGTTGIFSLTNSLTLSATSASINLGGTAVTDTSLGYNETWAQTGIFLGSASGRQFIFGEGNWSAKDHDHNLSANPTVYLQSPQNPDADNRQFVEWYNDGSNSYHLTGIGGHRFGFSAICANAILSFTGAANPWTDSGVSITVNTATIVGRTTPTLATEFALVDNELPTTLANLAACYNAQAGTGVSCHVNGNTVVFEANVAGTPGNILVTTEVTDTDNKFIFQKKMLWTANPTSWATAQPVIFTVGTGTLTGVWIAPGANQFLIGSTLTETLQSIVTAYNALATGVTAIFDSVNLSIYFNGDTSGVNTFTETVDTDGVYSFVNATMYGGRAFTSFMDMQPTYQKLTKQGTATAGTTTYASQYMGLTASGWNTTKSKADDVEYRFQTTSTTGASPVGTLTISQWVNGVEITPTTPPVQFTSTGVYAGLLIGSNMARMQFGIQDAGTGSGNQMWFAGLENLGAGAGTKAVGFANYDLVDGASAVGFISDFKRSIANTGAKQWSYRMGGVERNFMDKDGGVSFGFGSQTRIFPAEAVSKACTGTFSATAGLVDAGAHSYKITFVTADGESAVGAVSNTVTATDGTHSIDLTVIPCGTIYCTARKIYRTKVGDAGTWYYVATIANNTATTYNDGLADAALGVGTGPTTNTTIGRILGTVSDIATAVAHSFDTNIALTAAGTHIADLKNNGTTKAYVDYLGSFNAGAGTTLLPAYSFIADPNTGIWNSAGDTLGFVTGGTTSMTLSGTGLALTGTLTGITTALTGTINTALIFSIPNQGANTNNGVGITIQADDGGSGTTGGDGGSVALRGGNATVGTKAGGDVILDSGLRTGAGAPSGTLLQYNGNLFGYLKPATAGLTALGIMGAQADSGSAIAVAIGAYADYATAGGKIVSFRDNMGVAGGSELAYIDYLGGIYLQGNLSAVGANFRGRTVVGAADYNPSALTDDYYIAMTDTAAPRAVTISTEDKATGTATLPRIFIIKDESGACGTNNITVSLEGGGTIDGAATYVMNANYEAINLYVDGTNAFIY